MMKFLNRPTPASAMQEADILVKQQVSALPHRHSVRKFVKTKSQPYELHAVLAALTHYVQSSQNISASTIYAFSNMLKTCSNSPEEFVAESSKLLLVIQRLDSPALRNAIASVLPPTALNIGLSNAIQSHDTVFAKELLRLGAEPRFLTDADVLTLIEIDIQLFHHLAQTGCISMNQISTLSVQATQAGRTSTLQALLPYFRSEQASESDSVRSRNELLLVAIASHQFEALHQIVLATCHQHLDDANVLTKAMEYTHDRKTLCYSTLDLLLWLVQSPASMSDGEAVKVCYERSIQNSRRDVTEMLAKHGLPIPGSTIIEACIHEDMELLGILLKGQINEIPREVWTVIHASSSKGFSKAALENLLIYTQHRSIDVPFKEEVLLQCIANNQLTLATYLVNLGASVDYQEGAPLKAAVWSTNTDFIECLLRRYVYPVSLDHALLTAMILPLSKRPKVMRLLFGHRPNYRIIDFMILQILCNTKLTYDAHTLNLLFDPSAHVYPCGKSSIVGVIDTDTIKACVQSRCLLQEVSEKRISSQSSLVEVHSEGGNDRQGRKSDDHADAAGTSMKPVPDLTAHFTNYACDVDHVKMELLKRHADECFQTFGISQIWCTGIIEFLLFGLSPAREKDSSLQHCISLAVICRQADVFRKLLRGIAQLESMTDALSLPGVVGDMTMLTVLLEFLAEPQFNDELRVRILAKLFITAASGQQWESVLSVASRAPLKLSMTPIQDQVSHALVSGNYRRLNEIFQLIEVTQADLVLLWRNLFASSITHVLDEARVLLRAGLKDPIILDTLIDHGICKNNVDLCAVIVDEWNDDVETVSLVSCEDGVEPSHPAATLSTNLSVYQIAISDALFRAITLQHIEICRMLCAKGEAYIFQDYTILDKAISTGDPSWNLQNDAITGLLLIYAEKLPNFQDFLDHILLTAILHNRLTLVRDLVLRGASPVAQNCESWNAAITSLNHEMIGNLVSTPQAHSDLAQNFTRIFRRFGDDDKLGNYMQAFEAIAAAGYHDCESFSWALLILCCRPELLSIDLVNSLLRYGASVEYENGKILERLWVHGDLAIFEKMLEACRNASLIVSLLRQAKDRIIEEFRFFGSPDPEMGARVLRALLKFDIPKPVLNVLLSRISINSYRRRVAELAIIALLEHGARFSTFQGARPICHALLTNNQQLHTLIRNSRPRLALTNLVLRQMLEECRSDHEDASPRNALQALALGESQIGLKLSRSYLIDALKSVYADDGLFPDGLIKGFTHIFVLSDAPGTDYAPHKLVLIQTLDAAFTRCSQAHVDANDMTRLEKFIAAAIRLTHGPTCQPGQPDQPNVLRLDERWLSEALQRAFKNRMLEVSATLLDIGANPDTFNDGGVSALFLATMANRSDVTKQLVNAKVGVNDGSLHVAACQLNIEIVQQLLKAGHNASFKPKHVFGCSALVAFTRYHHHMVEVRNLQPVADALLEAILEDRGAAYMVKKMLACFKVAILRQSWAFNMANSLLTFIESTPETHAIFRDAVICVRNMRYSPLSLIERGAKVTLKSGYKLVLAARMEKLGVKEMYYAETGDQPKDAINIPLRILNAEEARKRKQAYDSQECSVCGDRPEVETAIHAALMPACKPIHGWQDGYVCTDCLEQYLKTRMFPDDEKMLFPSMKVPCWAPKCHETFLSHNVIQDYADAETFNVYDTALAQAALRDGNSMFHCSVTGCPGAVWSDPSDEAFTIFVCPICFANTCVECNDLYTKHEGKPCPASEAIKTSARIKEEEELTQAALEKEKKCPKCGLKYQRIAGCDTITCGKNAYDLRVDRGCRFQFCHECLDERGWPNHKPTCSYIRLMR